MKMSVEYQGEIDAERSRFPCCVVWTPLPVLSWLIPLIGHMGIGTSSGIIRDFSAPYQVSEDCMAFGKPTKYWRLDPGLADGGQIGWDEGVEKASNLYCKRMHYLFWDNCHSHVSAALNLMKYNGKTNYNMVTLFALFTFHSRYVSFGAFLKTWLPFVILVIVFTLIIHYTK